ncbi:MAG: DUF2029 domain-containing protein [Solirubrobacterales bacterium]|nr:DUF2029 domain-containing protein [Solirubrobacterales bacterium]
MPSTVAPEAPEGTWRSPLLIVAACLVLAALSLLLPSTPTYDPWAWIIWGREILHLDLVTTDGPSWKPLPALFTVPFALFGGAAPWLWLIVARAGALLGLVFAFRIARRLAGPFAGGAAAGALVLSPWTFKNAALGNSEGLMAAAVLGAIDRHLAGRYHQAFALGLGAALLRPEAWPFFGLYGLWLLWRERGRAALLVGGAFASLPVLWFGPELWGSGNLNRASDRAQQPNADSAAFAADPAVEVLRKTMDMFTTPIGVGLVALLLVLLLRRPSLAGRGRLIGGLALISVAWLAIVAVMTANGFSGNQRYLVMPVTILFVLGAVGLGAGLQELRRLPSGRLAGVLAASLAALACSASYWGDVGNMLDSLEYQGVLQADLERSVEEAGGPEFLRACGPAATGAFLVPAVAWQLDVHANRVGLETQLPGVVFRVQTHPFSNAVPSVKPILGEPTTTFADRGNWRILGDCG